MKKKAEYKVTIKLEVESDSRTDEQMDNLVKNTFENWSYRSFISTMKVKSFNMFKYD